MAWLEWSLEVVHPSLPPPSRFAIGPSVGGRAGGAGLAGRGREARRRWRRRRHIVRSSLSSLFLSLSLSLSLIGPSVESADRPQQHFTPSARRPLSLAGLCPIGSGGGGAGPLVDCYCYIATRPPARSPADSVSTSPSSPPSSSSSPRPHSSSALLTIQTENSFLGIRFCPSHFFFSLFLRRDCPVSSTQGRSRSSDDDDDGYVGLTAVVAKDLGVAHGNECAAGTKDRAQKE